MGEVDLFANDNADRVCPAGNIIDREAVRPTVAPAEQQSPWSLSHGKKVVFNSLPHDAALAIAKLRPLILQMAVDQLLLRAQA